MSPILTASSPGFGSDRQPAAVAVEQLQPRFLGAEQQGDGVDVLMRAGADVAAVARDRRIMEQAQHRIAVAHRVARNNPAARPRWRAIAARILRPAWSKAANSSRKVSWNDWTSSGQTLARHQLAKRMARRQARGRRARIP